MPDAFPTQRFSGAGCETLRLPRSAALLAVKSFQPSRQMPVASMCTVQDGFLVFVFLWKIIARMMQSVMAARNGIAQRKAVSGGALQHPCFRHHRSSQQVLSGFDGPAGDLFCTFQIGFITGVLFIILRNTEDRSFDKLQD